VTGSVVVAMVVVGWVAPTAESVEVAAATVAEATVEAEMGL
jgi:hypothetical protein